MDKAGGVSGGGVTKKQQHPLIELLLQYDFEEVYDRSIVSSILFNFSFII